MTETATMKSRIIEECTQTILKVIQEYESKIATLQEENDILRNNGNLPPTLAQRQAAEHCGVSVSTVSDWLRTGILKGKKINGRWLINREDFLAFLSSDNKPPLIALKRS